MHARNLGMFQSIALQATTLYAKDVTINIVILPFVA